MNSSDRDNLLDPSLKTPGIGFGGGAASYSGSNGGSSYGSSGSSSYGYGFGYGSGYGGGDFWGGGCGRGGTNSNDYPALAARLERAMGLLRRYYNDDLKEDRGPRRTSAAQHNEAAALLAEHEKETNQ